MPATMRRASVPDLGDLLRLMQEFYEEAGFPLNLDRAGATPPSNLSQVRGSALRDRGQY